MDLEDCPEFLKPRLRLFLSADIVGSTALKQSPFRAAKNEKHSSWFSKIQGFYFEADQAFRREFNYFREKADDQDIVGPYPKLWKTIGDEVVFVKEVTDHRQVVHTLRCWMEAIKSVRKFVKKDSSRLDVKCTSWLAGFPLRNSEVAVEVGKEIGNYGSGDGFVESGKVLERMYNDDPDVDAIVDYIGPSIDIGFRLAQFCTSRKFVVSVDVAFVLALANPGEAVKDPVFAVYFDGSHVLKGVLGGVRYPVFWLDLSPEDAIERLEDGLTSIAPVDRDRLREYCNQFYREYSAYTFPPFIVSDTEQPIKARPESYDQDHAALVRNFLIESSEEQSTGEPEPGEEAAGADVTEVVELDGEFIKFLQDIQKAVSDNSESDEDH